MAGNSLIHRPGALSFSLYILFFNASKIIPLARSTCPLALGCATETYFTTMLRSSQKSQNVFSGKLSPQVCNDTVGYTEAVDELVEELDCFFGRCLNQGHVLYPFGKFINQHEYELELPGAGFKGPIISSPQHAKGQEAGMVWISWAGM
jgi:hypothetical protein